MLRVPGGPDDTVRDRIRPRGEGVGRTGILVVVSQALYEITVNALLDRDRALTPAGWDAAVARVGPPRVPQLLAELDDAGLIGPELLASAVPAAWGLADRPLDRLPAGRWRELYGDAGADLPPGLPR
ncbi:hypothetical protein WIS52_18930 [Pseudonocardia nematodicida]|uniref:Uncharacterized protein n=1 Tax=Pseudonocardia nematodicida TaxID=1206997 RepID=A0ABV1KF96_9PSEU